MLHKYDWQGVIGFIWLRISLLVNMVLTVLKNVGKF